LTSPVSVESTPALWPNTDADSRPRQAIYGQPLFTAARRQLITETFENRTAERLPAVRRHGQAYEHGLPSVSSCG
jgi:hypothetical protein